MLPAGQEFTWCAGAPTVCFRLFRAKILEALHCLASVSEIYFARLPLAPSQHAGTVVLATRALHRNKLYVLMHLSIASVKMQQLTKPATD